MHAACLSCDSMGSQKPFSDREHWQEWPLLAANAKTASAAQSITALKLADTVTVGTLAVGRLPER